MQRLHPEFEGLVHLPAKKTLIYVKKSASAPPMPEFPLVALPSFSCESISMCRGHQIWPPETSATAYLGVLGLFLFLWKISQQSPS